MSGRKSKAEPEPAPSHIERFNAEHPLAAADDFAARVSEDARADVAMGRSIEDAQLIARGFAEEDKASRGGKASARARAGKDSKRALILAEAAAYQGSPAAKVITIARRVLKKHGCTVTGRYIRKVLKEYPEL